MTKKIASFVVAASMFGGLLTTATGCFVRTRDRHHHHAHPSQRRSNPPPPPVRDHRRGNDRCRWERC